MRMQCGWLGTAALRARRRPARSGLSSPSVVPYQCACGSSRPPSCRSRTPAQLAAAAHPVSQMQPQNVFDLLHRTPRLGHCIAPVAKRGERWRWIRPATSRPGLGKTGIRKNAGRRSGRSAKLSRSSPACRRNGVRRQSGIASVMDRCTQQRGARPAPCGSALTLAALRSLPFQRIESFGFSPCARQQAASGWPDLRRAGRCSACQARMSSRRRAGEKSVPHHRHTHA